MITAPKLLQWRSISDRIVIIAFFVLYSCWNVTKTSQLKPIKSNKANVSFYTIYTILFVFSLTVDLIVRVAYGQMIFTLRLRHECVRQYKLIKFNKNYIRL